LLRGLRQKYSAYPVDSCITVSDYGVQHGTSSAEWFMEDAIPQQKPEEYFENLGQVPWSSVSFSEGAESDQNWRYGARQFSWGAPEAPVMPGAPMMPETPVMPVAPVAPLALSAGSYTQTRSRPVFFAR
jgi:hypothetical protein